MISRRINKNDELPVEVLKTLWYDRCLGDQRLGEYSVIFGGELVTLTELRAARRKVYLSLLFNKGIVVDDVGQLFYIEFERCDNVGLTIPQCDNVGLTIPQCGDDGMAILRDWECGKIDLTFEEFVLTMML